MKCLDEMLDVGCFFGKGTQRTNSERKRFRFETPCPGRGGEKCLRLTVQNESKLYHSDQFFFRVHTGLGEPTLRVIEHNHCSQ